MLATLFMTSWTSLSHRKMQLIKKQNSILSFVTGMNSIPWCNDITGILPNTISYDHIPSLGFPHDTNMKRFYIP